MKVLIKDYDHSYREAIVHRIKVVRNVNFKDQYFEYVGDEYLEEGDELVEMDVVE